MVLDVPYRLNWLSLAYSIDYVLWNICFLLIMQWFDVISLFS